MKAFIFLCCTVMFGLSPGKSFSQDVDIIIDNNVTMTVKKVLKLIHKQTDYKFIYKNALLKNASAIQFKKGVIKTSHLLNQTLSPNGLDYEFTANKTIQVKRKVVKKVPSPKVEIQYQVNGTITDQDGIPLAGANVVEKGTTNGIQTDFDGNFAISVADENATLVISYLGFATKEIPLGGQTNISVTLIEDAAGLDEVVVVGYGRQTRKTVAGAVAQIDGEILEDRPITNALNGLQGAVAGLTITRSSGQPGNENYQLNVRGLSSLNSGNEPLVLINGVEGDINLINPNDIASVSVLKDASAAIYGARAAGGVVLITTKSGSRNQKLEVEYTSNVSINRPANLLDRVSLREWVIFDWEAKTNAGANPAFFAPAVGNNTLEDALVKIDAGHPVEWKNNNGQSPILNYTETGWENLIYKKSSIQHNHNINIRGGGERSAYNASFGFVDSEGIIKDAFNNSRRFNMRLNYDFDLSDRFKINSNISYTSKKDENPAYGNETIFNLLNRMFLWHPLRTQSGQYLTQFGFGNPRQLADKDIGIRTNVEEEIRFNLQGEYEIFDGLKAHGQLALNRNKSDFDRFGDIVPRYNYDDTSAGLAPNLRTSARSYGFSNYMNLTGYLDYAKTFGDHNVNLTAGASHEQREFGGFFATDRGLTQTAITTLGQGDPALAQIGEQRAHWAIRSFFARGTYILKDRYILEGNYRRDGTSVFSPEQRWGNFFGGSFAWRASEEDFIKKLNFFDNLKFRVSHGVTGNQSLDDSFDDGDDINLYDYIALVNDGNFNYPFGDGTAQPQAAVERGLVTSNRTWEDLKTTNIGIDFALFNSRFSGAFDWFQRKNDNMLLGVVESSVLGGNPPDLNIGALETKGFELTLTWADKLASGFSYSITGILSDSQNTLTNLDGNNTVRIGLNGNREGYSQNTWFGYVWDGILTTQDEVDAYKELDGVPGNLEIGDARYKDLNGDGRISTVDEDGNDADIVSYGTNAPRYQYSFNLGASYKGFDLSVFMQGVAERTIFYTDDRRFPFTQPWWTPLRRFYNNTWSSDRPNARYPRVTTGPQRFWNYDQFTENTIVNGAYLRVKNITLGYTLPQDLLTDIGIEKIRLFFSGEDLFTFDHLDGGYDAENTDGGADFYPYQKRYSVGITVNF
ncbi:SusC/RagA family TonB-linked outer membrane protein [Flagellimonas onchidii]|uniref:SusC/RagA family TonB-linked outer membrane protein n=1 Tax=Flagellimonas onchidii TaxID=2562684 RepID=UPI001455E651|nr:TonB-dependent receptor [Allomuricauda onchidii]